MKYLILKEDKNMKVLRLATYCFPEQVAPSHLINDVNEAYEKAGIISEIYTPTPTRGIDAETRKKYKKIKYEELYNGTVKIHRFLMFSEPKNSLLRAFRYTLCLIRNFFNGLSAKDIDIYYVSSTPPINGLLMAVLKKIKKFKTVYNLQDIFPDSLVNTGMTHKGSILWKIGAWIEKITYRSADKIIVISQDFKDNIMKKGVPEEKIEIVRNWVDENAVVSIERSENKLFDEYGLDREKFYVSYSGNVGYTQNMDMLLEVAEELKGYDNIGIIIVGDGAYKKEVERIVAEKKLSNVTLIPFQPYEDISYVFSLGNVGLLISKAGVGSNSVPSKTWSYMSAKRPILASFDKDSELCRILEENDCGICVNPDNKQELKEAILKMAENDYSIMGKNGREYVINNVSKEKCVKKQIDVLYGMLN